MKNLFFVALIATLFIACKKDEPKVWTDHVHTFTSTFDAKTSFTGFDWHPTWEWDDRWYPERGPYTWNIHQDTTAIIGIIEGNDTIAMKIDSAVLHNITGYGQLSGFSTYELVDGQFAFESEIIWCPIDSTINFPNGRRYPLMELQHGLFMPIGYGQGPVSYRMEISLYGKKLSYE